MPDSQASLLSASATRRRSTQTAAFIPSRFGRLPWAPMLFLASSFLLVVVLHRSFGFFDLKVYRKAAALMLDGQPLYGRTFGRGLGFTYPPIAALLFTLLPICSVRGDEIAVTLLNLTFVAVLAHSTMRLRAAHLGDEQPGGRSKAAWVAAAAAVWIWPVTSALGYGQIDLLVAALVLVDLTVGRDARWGGTLVGTAAALKLTPLIFIAYLALSRRPMMAARAVAVFGLSIALAFAVVPHDASAFWTGGGMFNTSHITGGGHAAGRGPANQSLHGALLRVAPGLSHRPAIWLAACALVGVIGLLLAVLAARRGDEAWGFVTTAVTGVLICPVTWVHHWVIAVPGLLLPITASQHPVRRRVLTAVALIAAATSWAIKPVIAAHPVVEHISTLSFLGDDLYVITGFAMLVVAAVTELSARTSVRTRRSPSCEDANRDKPTAAAVKAWEPGMALAAVSDDTTSRCEGRIPPGVAGVSDGGCGSSAGGSTGASRTQL